MIKMLTLFMLSEVLDVVLCKWFLEGEYRYFNMNMTGINLFNI